MTRPLHRATWVIGLLALVGCYEPPGENQLIKRFESHRAEFDTLLAMATNDSHFRRISGGEIPPRGMPVERYGDYLAIFQKLGIEDGLTWNYTPHTDGLFIIAGSAIPIGGTDRSIGYVYSAVPLAPIVRNLGFPESPFEVHSGHGERTVYRQLQDHWYLFYHASW